MTRSLGKLYLLFTPSLCVADPWDTLERALSGGVDLVQWRVRPQDPAGLARCIHVCHPFGIPVVVNDDVDLAARMDAAGAHVGQDDMAAARARKMLGDRWLGISTHDLAQIDAAVAAQSDYVGFGPCFPTDTKGYREGLSRELVADAAASCPVPLYAIGGIDILKLPLLHELGVRRVAVSSAILGADDPRGVARRMRRLLDKA